MRHTLLTTIRDLQLRRGRERRGLVLAEGVRLVEDALAAGLHCRGAAWSPSLEATPRGRALKSTLEAAGAPLLALDDRALAGLADTEHPQGVVAVIEPPDWNLASIGPEADTVLLVLDGVQDPGNVGTLLRTAHALGAGGVIALPGTAELTSPKVLRGSMGGYFRLPCVAASDPEWEAWAAAGRLEIWVAEAGGAPVGEARPGRPLALVVGNEGVGVRPSLAGTARGTIGIPLSRGAESLNVAVAAGILLYEVLHGR